MAKLVTFRIGRTHYALPVNVVREVTEIGSLRSIPQAPDDVAGLAEIRGRWVPVVDLERPPEDDGPGILLVLGGQTARLAVRADRLGEVIDPNAGERVPVPGSESSTVLRLDGEIIECIDPAALVRGAETLIADTGGPMTDNRREADPIRVVEFRLGTEDFGIDVMKVFEAVRVPDVRSVPEAPDFVEGMAEVRTAVVPVIDMRKRFSLPDADLDSETRMLVVALGDARVGLIVDRVPGVLSASPDSLSSPPEFFKGIAARYLEGILQHGDRLVILLDVDEILTSEEQIALEAVIERHSDDDADGPQGDAQSPEKGK